MNNVHEIVHIRQKKSAFSLHYPQQNALSVE